MIGQTITHYRLLEKPGEGGMCVVYKAEDTKLERPVALKFPAAHLVSDQEIRTRFEPGRPAASSLLGRDALMGQGCLAARKRLA